MTLLKHDLNSDLSAAESLVGLDATHLVNLLVNRAHELADKKAFIYLEGLKLTEKPVTYRELDLRARAIGTSLQKRLSPGDRALLVYDCDLEYIAGFFGCLYAGVVAVPVYIPTSAKHLPRMNRIIEDCQARLILTTTRIHHLLSLLPASKETVKNKYLTTDDIGSESASNWTPPELTAQSVAFLQYTSGSTGDPKGVVLTHQNLLSNLRMIREAFEFHDTSEVQVSWLPFYHDMGLIGAIMSTLLNKRTTVLMHPMSIVRPLNWLKVLQKYKATTTAAPNFAYDLCVQRISDEEARALDLSSVKLFMSGAESVRAQTLNAFFEKFKFAGLKKESLGPAYGLAEATLLVSTKKRDQIFKSLHIDKDSVTQGLARVTEARDQTTQIFVSCGVAAGQQTIAIFDPETLKPVSSMKVGEVWTRGNHVAQGYWKNPKATAETFVEQGGHRWLRTGDLGFMDSENELYIVGRSKDVLILMGKNYAPQDLEETVRRSNELIHFSVNAAFQIERDGKDQVVIVQEVPAGTTNLQLKEIEKAAREALSFEHGLQLGVLHFVEGHKVPRTSSGKVRRRETKAQFLANKLKSYKESFLTSKEFTRIKKNVGRKSKGAYVVWRSSRGLLISILFLIWAAVMSRK